MNHKLLIAALMAVSLVACKTNTPMTDTKPAGVVDKSPNQTPPVTSTVEPMTDKSVTPVVVGSDTTSGMSPLKDPNNILSKRQIYFDTGKDIVKPEFQTLVDAHAKYLLANPEAKMLLQGNTDERGTREFNLSLGQYRSVAVKKALNLLGVQDKQIETVSYGEEKVVAGCQSEDCYQKDRRVDIVYEGE